MSDYPEHDKLSAIQEQAQAAGEFAEWLLSQGVQFMIWCEDLTDQRLTDPQCATAIRASTKACAPVRPEGGSYSNDGTVWWRQHCLHWQDPEREAPEDAEQGHCCQCGRGRYYEVTGIKGFVPERRSITQLLADCWGIDQNKIEAEKRAMLAKLRADQEH